MYSNKFVMSVSVNGKFVEEKANGEVHIPINTHYVLRFHNKNSRRALVKFSIDGENASGGGYIIPSYDYIDIQRHSNVDAAFKLVALDSSEAYAAGKAGSNENKVKGTIVAKFYLEKESYNIPAIPIKKGGTPDNWFKKTWPSPWTPGPYKPYWEDPTHGPIYPYQPNGPYEWKFGDTPEQDWTVTCNANKAYTSGYLSFASNSPEAQKIDPHAQDACTVKGEPTGQTFNETYFDAEENFTEIRIYLKGIPKVENVKSPTIDLEMRKLELEQKIEFEKRRLELEGEIANLESELAKLKETSIRR